MKASSLATIAVDGKKRNSSHLPILRHRLIFTATLRNSYSVADTWLIPVPMILKIIYSDIILFIISICKMDAA